MTNFRSGHVINRVHSLAICTEHLFRSWMFKIKIKTAVQRDCGRRMALEGPMKHKECYDKPSKSFPEAEFSLYQILKRVYSKVWLDSWSIQSRLRWIEHSAAESCALCHGGRSEHGIAYPWLSSARREEGGKQKITAACTIQAFWQCQCSNDGVDSHLTLISIL